jgi:hypothetical protein
MAGAALDRELSTRFAVATTEDDAAIRRTAAREPNARRGDRGLRARAGLLSGCRSRLAEKIKRSPLSRTRALSAWAAAPGATAGWMARPGAWAISPNSGSMQRHAASSDCARRLRILPRAATRRSGGAVFHEYRRRQRPRPALAGKWSPRPAGVWFLAELDTLLIAVPRRRRCDEASRRERHAGARSRFAPRAE